MEPRPKKRTCPSVKLETRVSISRQEEGARKGMIPSIISMRATANRRLGPMPSESLPALARISEVPEKLRIRLEHENVIFVLEAGLISFQASIKSVELRIIVE